MCTYKKKKLCTKVANEVKTLCIKEGQGRNIDIILNQVSQFSLIAPDICDSVSSIEFRIKCFVEAIP